MRSSFYTCLSIVAFSLLISCGGGGGHGPSEPAPMAEIGGTWTGVWNVSGVGPQLAFYTISQSGATTSGDILVAGSDILTTGTVDTNASSFEWASTGGGCGSFTGTASFAGVSPGTMNGTATLNTLGCSTAAGFFTGPVTWTKTSTATAARSRAAGTLGALVEHLRGAARR
jgi:hypothetical protein